MTDQTIATDANTEPVEQQPEQSGPPQGWDQLAAEMFPDDYHPDREPPPEEPTRAAAREMAGEDADARALEADEGVPGAAAADGDAEEAGQDDAAPAGDDGLRWSTQDATTISSLEREIPSFQADLAQFEQLVSQLDLNALAATDRGKAQMLRVQLAEAQKELQRRQDDIVAAATGLQQKAQEHQLGKAKKHLSGEAAKLAKAMPDLDKKALLPYLKSAGFTEADIKQAHDHRLVVMAEKARRYDEMTANQRKVPKLRTGAKGRQAPAESPAFRAAIDDINARGLTRQNATTVMRNLPAKSNTDLTAAELMARLKQSGSMDDAWRYQQAADRERAQAVKKGARR